MAYEDWGDLSGIKPAPLPPEPPSLLGRIGERAANAPSDIFNDLMRLVIILVLRNVGQTEPVSVPVPYDQIPEARKFSGRWR